jgi:hypothetical protein
VAVSFASQGVPFTGNTTTFYSDTSLTIPAGANALIAMLQWGAIVTSPIVNWDSTGITNGAAQTMAFVGSKAATDSTDVYLFGLLAPNPGNLSFSASWFSGATNYCGNTICFYGADQTSFATTFKNLVTLASTTGSLGFYPSGGQAITTNPGDMAVMSVSSNNQELSPGLGLGAEIIALNTFVSGSGRYLAANSSSTILAANAQGVSGFPCALVGCAIAAGPPAQSLMAQICL